MDTTTSYELTIAVVDDEPEIVQAIERILSLRGWKVFTYGNAEQLLGALKVQEGRLSLEVDNGRQCPLSAAVLDHNLPGMNGAELAQRLRAMTSDLRIVMISAAPKQLERALGSELNSVVLLSKPFSIELLEASLKGN